MKKGLYVWCSAMLICAPTIAAADKGGATADKPVASILVEPDQLQKKLSNNTLRVLDFFRLTD